MGQSVYRIHLKKDAFKFSSAHMTVFPDGSKEPLHGHNYTAEVSIELKNLSFNQLCPFSIFKSSMREICASWDEKVLLPSKCPFFEVRSQTQSEIEFLLCGKRYVLPKDEILLLEVDNITAENLSAEFCRQFILKVDAKKLNHSIHSIEVRIDESPGQGASTQWRNA